MLLYFIIFVIGLGIMSYAFFEVNAWSALYFERKYRCIERFRKPQQLCDAISTLHNLIVAYAGVAIGYAGTIMLFNKREVDLSLMLLISMIAIFVDEVVLYLVGKYSAVPDIKRKIKKQWDTQKRVSKDNDHEVNMYNGAVRITEKYTKHNIFYMALTVITWSVLILTS